MHCISCTQVEHQTTAHRNARAISVCMQQTRLVPQAPCTGPDPEQIHDLRVSLGISTWLSTRNPLAWKQLCHALAFPFPFADVPQVESLGSQRMALKGHALHEKAEGQIFVILPLRLMTKTFSLMKQCRCVPTSRVVTARAYHSLFLASWGQQFMQHAHPGLLGSSNVLPCAALTAVSCESDQLLKSGFRYTNLPAFAYTNSQMIQRNLRQTPLA